MKLLNSNILVIFLSSVLFSTTSYACDKSLMKKFLLTVHDTVGLNSTHKINIIKKAANCNDMSDNEFSEIFREVIGTDMNEYFKNNDTSVPNFIESNENESSYPETQITKQKKVFNDIDTRSQILQIPSDKADIKLLSSKDNNSIVVELDFAADPKNSDYLNNYINRFELVEDGAIASIHKKRGNEYCKQMRIGSVFRMAGICLLNTKVSLPNNSSILVLDKNGDRVNKSSLPMIKSEFLLKLENTMGGNKIKLIKEYVKNNDPNDIFYSNDIQLVLNSVSFSEKLDTLDLLSPLIVRPLPTELFYYVMNDVSFNEKLDIVRMLSPLLNTPLSADFVHQTIRLIDSFDSLEAFKILATKVSKQDKDKLLSVIEYELSYFDRKEARECLKGL